MRVKKNPKWDFGFVLSLHLDFCVDAGWKGEILERIDRLRGGVGDVDEALVDFHLEGFATGLVDVWGFDDGESAALGRQRHRTGNGRAGADGGVNDLFCALVDHAVIIGLEADADLQTLFFFGFGHISFLCSITSDDR